MATLTTQTITVASGTVDLSGALSAAASGGDSAEVGPGHLLVVENGATEVNVTITTTGTESGLAISDPTYTVAANDFAIVPLANVFRGADGRASITYDDVTNVTVGVFKLGS